MSYTINKTDGSILTEVVDGSIDQTATDLTLIGKNSSSYGEFLNENLIHILENFANTSSPNYPIVGQLWFDTAEGRLKVYDGNLFKVSGGTIVATSVPSSIAQGDIWIDSYRQQLYFNDGIATILAGPDYSKQQGMSGLQTVDVLDINGNNHTIVYLYVAQVLLGIFSKEVFTPGSTIPGFSGEVLVGFNASTYSGVKFHAQATQADSLIDPVDGSLKTASDFIGSNQDSTVIGTLTIQDTTPIIMGPSSNNEIQIDNSLLSINSNSINQQFKIKVLNSEGLLSALTIISATKNIGLYTDVPLATLDVNGDAIIRGSLTVNGNLTTINTTNLEINDKLIELGVTTLPTNTTADGGGFSVVAGTDVDKTFVWDLSTTSWLSSEHINIPTGKNYKINGFSVLSDSTLGNGVVNSSLTNVGVLTALQVDSININDFAISYINGSQTNGDITLVPKGTGTVDVSSKKITNLANPVLDNDAVNLITLNNAIKLNSLALSLDTTGLTNSQIASNYLSKVFPAVEHLESTLCRVVCTDTGVVTIRLFSLTIGVWTFQSNI
jgi:hypothetical protein